MFNMPILDVAIGLALVYSLFAVVCSALSEWVAWLQNARARLLREYVVRMLRDQNWADAILTRGAIASMASDSTVGPAYLWARQFSSGLLRLLLPIEANGAQPGLRQLMDAIDNTAPESIRSVLRQLLADAARADAIIAAAAAQAAPSNDPTLINAFRAEIERWFDDTMEHSRAQFKRQAATTIAITATIVCLVMNIDSIAIATSLSRDPKMREAMVQLAVKTVESQSTSKPKPADEPRKPTASQPAVASRPTTTAIVSSSPDNDSPYSPASGADAKAAVDNLIAVRELGLPLGWIGNGPPTTITGCPIAWWLQKLVGILVSIVAVSLGAPFWFDMLNKLVNLRTNGPPPPRADAVSPTPKPGTPNDANGNGDAGPPTPPTPAPANVPTPPSGLRR